MSQDNTLKAPTAQAIRIQRQLEGQLNTETGRAKIIETFAEIQEAEAKGQTQPSWENDENQEEYNFIFRNGQEFNVIAPTLEFAKKQCQLFLEDPLTGIKVGDDWEVFDVEITDLEEVKDRYYKPPVITGGNSETVVATLPNESEEFKKAFEAKDEEESAKHYFKILEDADGNVIGEVEVDAQGNELDKKPAKKSKKSKK